MVHKRLIIIRRFKNFTISSCLDDFVVQDSLSNVNFVKNCLHFRVHDSLKVETAILDGHGRSLLLSVVEDVFLKYQVVPKDSV